MALKLKKLHMIMTHPEENHYQYPSLWEKKSYPYGMVRIGSKLNKFKNDEFWGEIAKISFLGYVIGDLKSTIVEILRFDGVKITTDKKNVKNSFLDIIMAAKTVDTLLQMATTNREALQLQLNAKRKRIFQFAKATGNAAIWLHNRCPKVTINNIIACNEDHLSYLKWGKKITKLMK